MTTLTLISAGVVLVCFVGGVLLAEHRRRQHERSLLSDHARRSRVLKAVAAAEYRARTKDARRH